MKIKESVKLGFRANTDHPGCVWFSLLQLSFLRPTELYRSNIRG